MSQSRRSHCLLALLVAANILSATAQVPAQTAPAPKIVTVNIKLNDLSMIIVPVSINGSGPYDFMLDTGAAKTIVDQKLADQLALPRVGEKTVVGVLASARMAVVHVNSLAVAGAVVPGGEVFSSDHPATVTGKVRGVLGEDFLQNFDLLIDYRQKLLQFDAPLGPLAESATGEHLPLQLAGSLHGKPTHNRLVVSAHIPEFGDTPLQLLVDSGANSVTLFRETLDQNPTRQETLRTGNFNQWVASSASMRTVRFLNLGDSSIPNLATIALARRLDVDTDGLLPTSLFHSIFISSQGRFAILNPSFPRTNR